MKIRTRLTLQFALIVAVILVIFSFTIYYASSEDREQLFRSRLKDRGQTLVKLLLEVEEVDTDLLKIIERHTTALPEEVVLVYDEAGTEVFRSTDSISTVHNSAFISDVLLRGEVEQLFGSKEAVGFVYSEGGSRNVVIAEAHDVYGFIKLQNLRLVIFITFLSSMIIALLAGWFYSGQALRPISKAIADVDQITATKLDVRLDTGNKKDEMAHLAITFNKMLERLQSAFEMQRSFVSNASHELRTPLTAITGQIEVTLMNNRSPEEYRTILTSILEDIRNMNSLANGLLDLAQASLDVSLMQLENIRLDEALWQARTDLLKLHPPYQVAISYSELPEEEKSLTVFGNHSLLKSAFLNIMDNACKFSNDKTVDVALGADGKRISIKFRDNGLGIRAGELSSVFQPFFRGSNSAQIRGHGLGLSLTKRIVEMHNGSLQVRSETNRGTLVTVILPLANQSISF